MSNIERCWVEISDDDEQIVGGLTLDDPADFMVTDGFKLVEYVRADAYRGAVTFTPLERDALLGLVSMIVNDGLDTYGVSGKEQAAIGRALAKLARGQ